MASPRGDEAHAMAAYRVLTLVAPPDRRAAARFEEILNWGQRNRREFHAPWVYRGEMAEIYREIAHIVPTNDMLSRASEFFIGRHQAAMEARPPGTPGASAQQRFTFDDMQQLQAGLRNTPADLAILYLRLGDLQTAADQIAQVVDGGQNNELAAALRAIAQGEGGADAMFELASRLEHVDAGAQGGICRRARRQYPNDARFARCLAIAAAREGDLGLASAHLEAAVALAPNDAGTLRAAVEASSEWLQGELGEDDASAGRRAYARARALLDQWSHRFPREAAPVTVSELEDLAAQLELGQANLAGAQQHLERATQASPPVRDAYLTLAEIAWRHADGRRAMTLLEQGLAVPVRPNESDSTFRPTFLLRQGLAARQMGDAQTARTKLTEAQTALEALTHSLEGNAQANAYYWHAVASDALGHTDHVRDDLNSAVNAAPDSRDLAARAITFAMARGRWTDVHELSAGARGRLQLDRPWQVYFALWGVIATRLGAFDSDDGAADALETIAASASAHSPWTVRLAQRYHGTINRDQLLHYAQNAGQRAEALFYEAMLELAANDFAGAERDLRAVVQSDMLRYFEYDMAWEMLARGLQTIRSNSTNAAAPASASGAGTAAAGATTPSRH
jgi:hypothetical protein